VSSFTSYLQQSRRSKFDLFGLDPTLSLSTKESVKLLQLKMTCESLNLNPYFDATNWLQEVQVSRSNYFHPSLGQLAITSKNKFVIKKKALDVNFLLEIEISQKMQNCKTNFNLGVHYFLDNYYGCTLYEIQNIVVDLQTFSTYKELSHPQIYFVIFQVLQGLEILHSESLIHGAVTAGNIFICGNVAKIGNFEYACVQGHAPTKKYKKFPNNGPDQELTPKTDVWSVGITFCSLMFKHKYSPFDEVNQEPTTERQHELFIGTQNNISKLQCCPDQRQFIEHALQYNSRERMCVSDLKKCHIFTTQNDLF
jgi:serine/threonine protein kinase